MNIVEPIRDPELLSELLQYFKERQMRDYVFFLLGIYTGLRVSDILSLKVSDLKDKSHLNIREKKTKKYKRVPIHKELRRELKPYLSCKDGEEFVIRSRNGQNKPITRKRAYQILREGAAHFKLESIGCHTLRKTFGYHFYKQSRDIALLMDLFNHSSPTITLRYIGINQDTMDEAIRKFSYK